MGHLTRMANALVQNTEKGPNAEQLGQLLKGEGLARGGGVVSPGLLHIPVRVPSCRAEMSAEQQEQWEAFVSGPLAETNKKNMVDLVRPPLPALAVPTPSSPGTQALTCLPLLPR